MEKVINLNCPGCGAPVSTQHKTCEFCNRPIVITSITEMVSMSPLEVNKYANAYRKELVTNPDSKDLNMSLAMCYFKLKMYDNATVPFAKAIEDNFDRSETFFYAAINLLKGKKAFVVPRANIDKILEYLNAANMIEPKAIHHYFLAYIKQDYFERKYLNISPNWKNELATALEMGLAEGEVGQLFELLEVEQPTCLNIS
jgi:tetratricopeptide (TPR) repeat protein